MFIVFPDTVIVIILINRIYKKFSHVWLFTMLKKTPPTVNDDAMGEDLNEIL